MAMLNVGYNQKKHDSSVHAVGISSLRIICNVRFCNRLKNTVSCIENGVLRWFGRMERMKET